MLFFYNSLIVTIIWIFLCFYLLINSHRISFLRSIKLSPASTEPSIAVIIPIRNEEADLEEALECICNLDYTNYRLFLVNDRSSDRTPQILERFSQKYPGLTVVHIQELPKDWLGKCYALFEGYNKSTEEWLLFTDADVVFKKDTLTKAINYSVQ
jgi:glycosyltransferase involved in cell wall biosynthesis